jgi:hypothetical protein
VNNEDRGGGPTTVFSNQEECRSVSLDDSRTLSALGHEVDLVTYHIGQDVPILNVTIHRIPLILCVKRIFIDLSLTKLFLDGFLFVKTIPILFRSRYDLFHTHEEPSFFGFMLAKLFRIRLKQSKYLPQPSIPS